MFNIKNYTIEELPYREAHLVYDSLERGPNSTILTGSGPEDISRTSLIGINPFVYREIDKDIWNELRYLNNSTNFHAKPFPISKIGAIGTISYEALFTLENIEKKTRNTYSFPLVTWILYQEYFYFDNREKRLWKISLDYDGKKEYRDLNRDYYRDTGFFVESITPDYSPDEYRERVKRVREYIYRGDVYEVNLTQGLRGSFSGSPYSLFKKLYRDNSAPYSAYMERDNYTIVSNSPELYLKCSGKSVETRPIKGTAPRSSDSLTDSGIKKELFDSKKNQAELYMIVDLMRNDLSRVSKVGSVTVESKKRIEDYRNLHHLVAIVKSELDDNYDYIDLLKGTFPGGSITGCPKVSCMTISEELEKSSRNLYTGSIFIMNQNFLNSSIVIRTSIIKDSKIHLNSGGAITIDSNPDEEYDEILVKLKTILKALNYDKDL